MIIITGMHRSGTSMVTGILQKCGLILGDNLISGFSDNPKGHFENKEFVWVNDNILKDAGFSWRNPPNPNIRVKNDGKIIEEFLVRYKDKQIMGFKDPRACLTIHIWVKYIENLKLIICGRKKIEVAESLKKRNKFELSFGKNLYDNYTEHIYRFLNEHKPDFETVDYQLCLKDWKKELSRIITWAGLEIPEDTSEIDNFIDKSLCHHRA